MPQQAVPMEGGHLTEILININTINTEMGPTRASNFKSTTLHRHQEVPKDLKATTSNSRKEVSEHNRIPDTGTKGRRHQDRDKGSMGILKVDTTSKAIRRPLGIRRIPDRSLA